MITGRIKDFARDIFTRKQVLTLEVEGDCSELIEKLKDEKLTIDIKKLRNKRSLNANSYYWALVHQISKATGNSDAFTHNTYLRDCRCVKQIAGVTLSVPVPDTDEAEDEIMNSPTQHLYPTNKVVEGKTCQLRYYIVLKGSSEFDSAEMARLIEFAVRDAKDLGIPTITETEQKKLIELYGIKGGKK